MPGLKLGPHTYTKHPTTEIHVQYLKTWLLFLSAGDLTPDFAHVKQVLCLSVHWYEINVCDGQYKAGLVTFVIIPPLRRLKGGNCCDTRLLISTP